MTHTSRPDSAPQLAGTMPTGDELFVGVPAPLIEAVADRYGRKPNGTSDQGYKED